MEVSPPEPQYFIGVGLPLLEGAFFTKLKTKFHSTGKNTSPAHLTLKQPFTYPNRQRLVDLLTKWARSQTPFTTELFKLGSFQQRKYGTVWLEPHKGEPFKKLAVSLDVVLPFLPATTLFHPHLTIANRVPLESLIDTKRVLRSLNLKLKLRVGSITLYHRLPPQTWQAVAEFPFSSGA